MTAIAIDGPAGAGKSSVARAVADRLGFRYLDTGAMYRAVALAAAERGVGSDDATGLAALVASLELDAGPDAITIEGRDVTEEIRSARVTEDAARVARHPAVREALVGLQRRLASQGDVVMEGRDIGTEVLPDAEVKIYRTASLDERARRRCRQVGLPETDENLTRLRTDIERRDESDRTRATSPLRRAEDAVVVDTTELDAQQVIDAIVEVAERAGVGE